ncbi:calcium:proton antiporter [Acuticoccus mangrovi]|uniref:Calcium:proton antiporter n=1 Tax=Acuticoccus mangrovi TaxID=2796142 RepID=A0A934IDQ0_9HYPH|nr:calcium:proton antiporter [Acuticoccus mangrovi]MBJ3774648.1 calcium:proton antiporter [Acuticoccus mangrovi]
MAQAATHPTHPLWVILVPLVAGALVVLEETHVVHLDTLAIQLVAALILGAAVFAAVHHAEVLALRIGEPLGSLVLAAAVTVIEVSLIISMMLAIEGGGSEIARDTVFSAVMIVLTGIIGLCLLVGGVFHREQGFQIQGASGALSVLATLATLALILPNFTVAVPGPVYSTGQLMGVGLMSLLLYALFIFVQSWRHRDYFIDMENAEEAHPRPDGRLVAVSIVLLAVSLLSVVLIAEGLSPAVEDAVSVAGLPDAFVGVVIAALVLLPEGLAALRAARANQLQKSLNLALGSALASIGLTIPVVGAASVMIGAPLSLGLEAEHIVLLVLALFTCTLTLTTGRTSILQGGVHLVIFAAFLIVAAVP